MLTQSVGPYCNRNERNGEHWIEIEKQSLSQILLSQYRWMKNWMVCTWQWYKFVVVVCVIVFVFLLCSLLLQHFGCYDVWRYWLVYARSNSSIGRSFRIVVVHVSVRVYGADFQWNGVRAKHKIQMAWTFSTQSTSNRWSRRLRIFAVLLTR